MKLCTKFALPALWCNDSRREAYRSTISTVDVTRPDVPGSISDAIAYFLINYTGSPLKY